MEEKLKGAFNNIVEAAEELDWKVNCEVCDKGRTISLEFQQHSPAGEDFSFQRYANTPDEMVKEIKEYCEDFDPETRCEELINAKANGLTGVPNIRTLIDDAEDIKEMLCNLSKAVGEAPTVKEYLVIGELLEISPDKKRVKAIKEHKNDGMCGGSIFKDYYAFLNNPDELCYIPEHSLSNWMGREQDHLSPTVWQDIFYTKNDILKLVDGDEERAYEVFDNCWWQNPETFLDEQQGGEEPCEAE